MPMNGDLLGDEMKAAIDSAVAASPEAGEAQRTEVFRAIGAAIVAHIQANAVVSTNVAVVSVSAVTPGMGASGPGTGTGSGTIA